MRNKGKADERSAEDIAVVTYFDSLDITECSPEFVTFWNQWNFWMDQQERWTPKDEAYWVIQEKIDDVLRAGTQTQEWKRFMDMTARRS